MMKSYHNLIIVSVIFIGSFHYCITYHSVDQLSNKNAFHNNPEDKNHESSKIRPEEMSVDVFKRDLKVFDSGDERDDAKREFLNSIDENVTEQMSNRTVKSNQSSISNHMPIKSKTGSRKNDKKMFFAQAQDSISYDESENETFKKYSPIQVYETQNDDRNNSTLKNEPKRLPLFKIGKDQYLIDGYPKTDNDNDDKLFFIEKFITKLIKYQKLSATIEFTCASEECDQKIMLITVDRLVLKYELIRQNIFLDQSAKFYEYLDCFHIQYNPHSGLKGYLRNGFTYNYKKAFINTCMQKNSIVGSIYLTNEFDTFIRQQNLKTNVLMITCDDKDEKCELRLAEEKKWQSSKDDAVINNLKLIHTTYRPDMDSNRSSESCANDDETYLSTFQKILNEKSNTMDRMKYLNHLNSSLFQSGLHQKPKKLKFIKSHLIFDSGLLKKAERENFKVLNHLFKVIYESQNHFKQLNIYLVVVRLRFKMPNDLNIYSNTDLKVNTAELFEKIEQSDDETYFDLPADFKILFTSFKIYHNTSILVPSFNSDNIMGSPNSTIAIDFSYLQTNHWLLTYEIAHLLGIKDDDDACKCFSDQCIMKRSSKLNELTWSQCSIKQLDSNMKAYKFNFDLPVQRTKFKADFFNVSICGNGVLESGEQCDCGEFGCFYFDKQNQTYLPNRCCNTSTCELADKSLQCAQGSCCDLSTCLFHASNHVCRSSEDVCDIEETCDGVSAFCEEDDFYVDGELCGMNRICMNKRCVDSSIEFNCRNVFGENAFESITCWKRNLIANKLFNCGYSITDRRWTNCKSIEQARCGSFQCAVPRNSTNSIRLKLGKLFDMIRTETDVNRTHECVQLIVKQSLDHSIRSLPFYVPDGTKCSSDDDSLINLKFCSAGECKSNREFIDYENCYLKANCSEQERCTQSGRCRCELFGEFDRFNFSSAYFCPEKRSLPFYQFGNEETGLFNRYNFLHLAIVPCFATVLILTTFLRSYFRKGIYRVDSDTIDEMSASFSGQRPVPYWLNPNFK